MAPPQLPTAGRLSFFVKLDDGIGHTYAVAFIECYLFTLLQLFAVDESGVLVLEIADVGAETVVGHSDHGDDYMLAAAIDVGRGYLHIGGRTGSGSSYDVLPDIERKGLSVECDNPGLLHGSARWKNGLIFAEGSLWRLLESSRRRERHREHMSAFRAFHRPLVDVVWSGHY